MSSTPVRLHPHAVARIAERGATEAEVVATVQADLRVSAAHGRTGFRLDHPGSRTWRGRAFDSKEVTAYAVWEDEGWLVITVIVRFLGRRA